LIDMKRIINLVVIISSMYLLSACHQKEIVNISKPSVEAGAAITSDTLKGSVKGTMLSGKTYYFKSDVTVNNGDTLLMQSGVRLIAIGDGTSPAKSPQLTIYGTFISLGTQTEPNFITVPDAQRTPG
jgi:hypothetical protein